MVKVSIIIPTYNRGPILPFVLNALSQQTYDQKAIEIIISDDGSTDETHEVIRQYSQRLNLIHLRQPREGHRVSKIRNQGIQAASGEILIFLDADMIVSAEYVNQHVLSHTMHKYHSVVIGYVYGYRQRTKEAGLPSPDKLLPLLNWNDISSNKNLLKNRTDLWDNREIAYKPVEGDLNALPAPWRFLWGNSFSISRRNAFAVGMFDEDFKVYGSEDTEFSYRCYKHGLKFTLNRHAWGVHYPHQIDTKANDNYKLAGSSRILDKPNNRLLIYNKHPNPEIELYLATPRYKYNSYVKSIRALYGKIELPQYDNDQYRSAWDDLGVSTGKHNLVIGCNRGAILQTLPVEVATDIDQRLCRETKHRSPATRAIWALGVLLPYNASHFDNIIITDFWRLLPPLLAGKVLRESVRLGRHIFVIHTPSFESPIKDVMCHDVNRLGKICHRMGLHCGAVAGAESVYRVSAQASPSD